MMFKITRARDERKSDILEFLLLFFSAGNNEDSRIR